MAGEISEITQRNQEYPSDISCLHAELHEALGLLRKMNAAFEEFRPLLDRYRTPLAAAMASRRSRGRPE